MELPNPLSVPGSTLAALASFIRQRLGEVGDGLAGQLGAHRTSVARRSATTVTTTDATTAARQFAMVIVGAAAPFAPTSYARARMLRQMYASGLLSAREAQQADTLLELAQ